MDDGGFLGTRLYFVLLGCTSASNSLRKFASSCSARSALETGFEAGGGFDVDGGGSVEDWDGVGRLFSSVEVEAGADVDQSHPIVKIVVESG